MLRLLLVLGLLTVTPALAAGGSGPEVVAVYPNPVTDGDDGEFVVIDVPPGVNLSRYALTDGESTVSLPAVGPGQIAIATTSPRPARLDDRRVRTLADNLQLANGGERLRLVQNGTTVDDVTYRSSHEGAVLAVTGGDRHWRPLGATDRPVTAAGAGRVRAFVLPDAGGLPTNVIATAEERILLAGYTLTSARVTTALLRAHRRNVSVRVLLDADPVGGMVAAQVRQLDRLDRAGVPVTVLGGPRARFRFHHAKYAIVDDRAVVTTENWKPSGTGGHANRGWGVVTNQSAIVAGLVETFRADAGWADGIPWGERQPDAAPGTENASEARFGQQFEPARLPVAKTRLLLAPDNAESAVLDLLADAEESIWIEQVGVGGVRQPFVRAAIDAARRGVSVRLLVGSAWYNEKENKAVAEQLRTIAEREDLDLAVRLVDPRGRFARLHAKAAVVDGDRVLLGSLNWNNNSARNNREVTLLLEGERIGGYFGEVIRADWEGGQTRLSIGLAFASLLAAVGAGTVARRIRYEDETSHPAGNTLA